MEDSAQIEQLRRQVDDLSKASYESIERNVTTERQLVSLLEASGALLASPDPHSAVRTVLELAARFIAADAYAVWRRQDHDGNWERVASATRDGSMCKPTTSWASSMRGPNAWRT